jgi:selenide, water dikinase
VLDKVLGKLARQHDPNVLVGFDFADDAGVYQISADTALVQTVDFFTPIVDDPYTFGQIAATNSLSDVYAMGGRPLTALALVCFPDKGDLDILEQILAGGLSKMMEAGCTIVGGHSIRDEETKFGYSVTGLINPNKVLANKGAQPGDRLLLTKALGTGVISTAIKKGTAHPQWIDAAVQSMTTLNKAAAEVITNNVGAGALTRPAEQSSASVVEGKNSAELCSAAPFDFAQGRLPRASGPTYSVHALTDITGFGLIGHAREMARASEVSIRIRASQIPVLPGAFECIRSNYIPGGLKANREFAECVVQYEGAISEEVKTLLFDPQTAGGLFIAVAAGHAPDLLRALEKAGVPASDIGEVLPPGKPLVAIAP